MRARAHTHAHAHFKKEKKCTLASQVRDCTLQLNNFEKETRNLVCKCDKVTTNNATPLRCHIAKYVKAAVIRSRSFRAMIVATRGIGRPALSAAAHDERAVGLVHEEGRVPVQPRSPLRFARRGRPRFDQFAAPRQQAVAASHQSRAVKQPGVWRANAQHRRSECTHIPHHGAIASGRHQGVAGKPA